MKRTTVALLTLLVSVLTWDVSAAAGPTPSANPPAPPAAAAAPSAAVASPPVAAPTPPATAPTPAPSAAAPSPPWLRPAPAKAAETPAPSSSSFSFGKLAALLLVVGLGGYALYVKKKRAAQNPLKSSGGLRVIESARLGPKAALVTAVVGRRVILLGVTEQSVQKLGWLSPASDGEELDAEADDGELISSELPAAAPARPVLARDEAPRSKPRPSDGSFASKLRAALGTTAPATADDALATSAQLTRDVVDVGRGRRRARPANRSPERTEEAMIDVEAQAAGLIRRLKGKSQ